MAVNPYMWLVCAKIVKIGEVRGSPPRTACSVQGASPPKEALSARGTSPRKAMLSVRGTSPAKVVLSVRGTSPPKAVLSVRGTSPLKPTPGFAEEGARSPPVRRRWMPLSPTGSGFVNPTGSGPLRSYSVAGSGKRAKKIGDAVGAAFTVLE